MANQEEHRRRVYTGSSSDRYPYSTFYTYNYQLLPGWNAFHSPHTVNEASRTTNKEEKEEGNGNKTRWIEEPVEAGGGWKYWAIPSPCYVSTHQNATIAMFGGWESLRDKACRIDGKSRGVGSDAVIAHTGS